MCQFTRHRITNCQRPQTIPIEENPTSYYVPSPSVKLMLQKGRTGSTVLSQHPTLSHAADSSIAMIVSDYKEGKLFCLLPVIMNILGLLNLSRITEKISIWDLAELQKQAILDYEDGLVVDYSSTIGGVGGQTKE